jgi:hypothetical protein
MSKRQSATTPADTDGLATFVVGDAVAIGEETLSLVSATSRIADNGNKTKAEGSVTATAVASSSPDATTLASANTDVAVTGADKVVVKTKEISIELDEGSYGTSTTKFKAIDRSRTDDETQASVTKVKHHERLGGDADYLTELDGNVASATFDAQAAGQDSLVVIDVFALAMEDELSLATVMITSAVG